jgi:uncharacterized protein (TIGR00255 family)
MIHSMTAFSHVRLDLEPGFVAVEIRSVNSRFLDLSLRLPDEFRHSEPALRELVRAQLTRGKVELRVTYANTRNTLADKLDPIWLESLADQLQAARCMMPDVAPPRLIELLHWPHQQDQPLDAQIWDAACMQATQQALAQLQAGRQREGQHLAAMLRDCARSAVSRFSWWLAPYLGYRAV